MTITDDDTGGLGIDLAGRLSLHLGRIDAQLARTADLLARQPMQPIDVSQVHTFTTPSVSTAPVVVPCGSPSQGFSWYMRGMGVAGPSIDTAVGGRADVFIRGADPSVLGSSLTLAKLGTIGWRDQAVTLPATAFYGRGEMMITPSESLFVVLSGFTVQTQYSVNVTLEQIQDAPAPQVDVR